MGDWKKEYQEKLMSAEEAVKLVKSGDRVYAGTASSFAYGLLEALWDRRHELEGVCIYGSNGYQHSSIYYEGEDNPFSLNSYFTGVNERKARSKGIPYIYNSVHLSQAYIWCREIANPNVAMFEVSPCDENGYMTYGPSGVALGDAIKGASDKIIVQVNRNVPYVLGEGNLVHVSEVDAICEIDWEFDDFTSMEPDEISNQIAAHILKEIPDGATFQLGIGNIANAIGYGLREKNELGIHTELLTQSMIDLIKNGNVTNRNKGYLDGKTVYSFGVGSNELYRMLDRNPDFHVMPFDKANDARIIAQNRNMISINGTMAFNLFGEAASDCIGWKQQSGTGGQLDFVRGAQWSEGGKSFLATASSFEKGGKRYSKILPYFEQGTVVTTPRSDMQYIATEYGCVNLKPLSINDRTRAIIGLAHPDFRDMLTEEAKKHGLI